MSETTREDRFFGVNTPMVLPGDEPEPKSPDIELEIVDDVPRQPSKQADDDEELSSYGEKVRKRINKLRYEQHEAERQREAAERMREEAVRYAQQLAAKNQEYESLIQRGEGALVSQIKEKATIALERARSLYREAYEQGDTEKIIAAQESMLTAQTELREAEKHEQVLQSRGRPQQQPVQQPAQPQVAKPSEKALEWTQRNPWFGPRGNRVMTALAYGVHEQLIREEGVKPDTDEYYQKIDEAMRQRFPDYFEQEGGEEEQIPSTQRPAQRTPSTVVAPSNRNNGTKPRKIQLTATQVALSKRLGITPEQYARQLIKQGEF